MLPRYLQSSTQLRIELEGAHKQQHALEQYCARLDTDLGCTRTRLSVLQVEQAQFTGVVFDKFRGFPLHMLLSQSSGSMPPLQVTHFLRATLHPSKRVHAHAVRCVLLQEEVGAMSEQLQLALHDAEVAKGEAAAAQRGLEAAQQQAAQHQVQLTEAQAALQQAQEAAQEAAVEADRVVQVGWAGEGRRPELAVQMGGCDADWEGMASEKSGRFCMHAHQL
eukprot:1158835-Pelagomonas_calceolata.AAC.13